MCYRPFFLGTLLAALLLVFATTAGAQIPQITLQTQTPTPGSGHDYIQQLNETVDPSNGAVTIKINVPLPSGRQLSVPFYIMYNSGQVLSPLVVYGGFGYQENHGSAVSDAGWTYTVPAMTLSTASFYDPNLMQDCSYATDYVFFDGEGNGHTLSIATADSSEACLANGYVPVEPAQNGTLLSYEREVTDADGTTYLLDSAGYLASQIEDRNGNLINVNVNPCCNGVFNYTDTMGRTILSSSGFGSGTTTVQSSKFVNPYTVHWGTASYDYTVNVTNNTSDPRSLNCTSFPTSLTASGSVPTIQSIALPNGQSYNFTYDPTYGRVSKVTYPSGAYVRYVWGIRQNLNEFGIYGTVGGTAEICVIYASEPVIADRYVSPDGITETEHQHFSYSSYYPGFTPSTTRVDTDLTTNQVIRTVTYNYTGAITDPVPYDPQQYGTRPFIESSVVYSSGSSTLRTVSKTWHNSDSRELASQKTTLEDGSTASETDYCYNSFYQVTEKDEFDYSGTGSPGTTCNSTTAPGPLRRKTVISYASFGGSNGQWINDRPSSVITYDGSGSRASETDYSYGNTTSGVTATSHDDAGYGSNSALNRGNLVSATKQCFPSCLNATTSFTYDDTGQVLTQTDPNQNISRYSYVDSFATGTPPGATDGYLTQITYPTTNGVNHIEKFSYNYADGTLASSTDQNNLFTSYIYSDSMDRLTSASYPDGGETQYGYNDAAPITTTETKKITNSLNLLETRTFDGLAREIRKDRTNGEVLPYDETDTCYDGIGRVSFQSYPYQASNFSGTRCSNSVTPGDSFAYDGLDRAKTVTHSDGSVISTSYTDNSTTVTDEAGNTRESTTDSLERLTQVIENPGVLNYATNYAYDALSNLTSVVQNGSRNRTFAYDSLSRLTSSTNPESNWSPASLTSVATTYSYDADGNLVSKIEPAQNQQSTSLVTLTYCYDALNRMIAKGYTAQTCTGGTMPTPVATYAYDGSAPAGCSVGFFSYVLPVGKRTAMCDAAGSEAWAYSIVSGVGSQTTDQRTTSGITKTSVYQGDLLGSPLSIQYPSGRTINYSPNAADRPTSATDGSGLNYASSAHYAASGAQCWAVLGGRTTVSETLNSRLQPNQMQAINSVLGYSGGCPGVGQTGNLLDLSYNFNLGRDNGNVTGIVNNRDTTRSQAFMYDPLNRLSQATASTYAVSPAHCWGESYQYDSQSSGGAWGNLTAIGVASSSYNGCTQESLSLTVDTNNRISSGGYGYDTAGNMIVAPPNGTGYSFNAENQMVQALTFSGTTGYLYDGDGKRVAKTASGTPFKLYWYDLSGNVLDETDATGSISNSNFNEYIFFGGKRIARRND